MQTTQPNQPRRFKQQGFTLIELLIVVAIIGILAAVGVPQYGNYLDRSQQSACIGELTSFRAEVLAANAIGEDPADFTFNSCDVDDNDVIVNAFLGSAGDGENASFPVSVDTTRQDNAVEILESGAVQRTQS